MAYDEKLAARVRKALARTNDVDEKQMFGGVAFLLRGNMCVGVHQDALIVRIDPADTNNVLRTKHTRIFDITGRPMKGWIMVAPQGVAGAKLGSWIRRAKSYVRLLPAK